MPILFSSGPEGHSVEFIEPTKAALWRHVDVARPQPDPSEIALPCWDRWSHPSGVDLFRWRNGEWDVRCDTIWPRMRDGQVRLDVPLGTSPEDAQQAAIAMASEAARVLAAKIDEVRRALR